MGAAFSRSLWLWTLVLSVSCFFALPARADEARSRKSEYLYFFPFMAQRAMDRGITLPLPWGIGANYMFLSQDIKITSIRLSINDHPTQQADFIGFHRVRSQGHAFTVRPDLWVLPFLNIYGIFGGALASTRVQVDEPIHFTSLVQQGARTMGFGVTGTVPLHHLFIALDANFTWTKLQKLLDPVPGTMLSMRLGKNFAFDKHRSLAIWVGGMYQAIRASSNGKLALDEAISGETIDHINQVLDGACDRSSRPVLCHRIADQIREKAPKDTTVNYHLDKELKTPVNLVLGAQMALSRKWQVRTEVGLIGRYSVLLSANYRFGFKVR